MRAIVENPLVWLVLLALVAGIVGTFVAVLRTINRGAQRQQNSAGGPEEADW